MPETIESSKYWKNRIERDITSFGDPGATVTVSGSGRRLRATWTMRGKDHDAVFSTSLDRGVSVDVGGRHLTYRAFVASTDMADLQHVARMILQASKPGPFVPTRADYTDDLDSTPRPALDLLTTLLDHENHDATRVIMVTGDAGSGSSADDGHGRRGLRQGAGNAQGGVYVCVGAGVAHPPRGACTGRGAAGGWRRSRRRGLGGARVRRGAFGRRASERAAGAERAAYGRVSDARHHRRRPRRARDGPACCRSSCGVVRTTTFAASPRSCFSTSTPRGAHWHV